MYIIPESSQVRKVFIPGAEDYYNIPIYQRNYSWGYDNIETFFNDVNNEKEGYYIGNLLITPNEKDSRAYDVVDGQQRLTTIVLMLLAINHIIYEKYDMLSFEDLQERKLYNTLVTCRSDIKRQLVYEETTDEYHPRLLLLDDDMVMYTEFLKILVGDLYYKPYKNRVFGKRYHFIKELIEDGFFEKDDDGNYINYMQSFDKISKFYKKLNSIEILIIKVNNLTDAFSIFTSFNSKGLPLTLIDLLKSYYLKNAVTYLEEEDALSNWHELISFFHDDNGEPISSLVTQFLQNYYDTFESKSTSSITKSQSLREYETLFARKGGDYINELIDGARIFSSFTNNIGKFNDELSYTGPLPINERDEDIDYYIKKLAVLDTTAVYPIIMFLLTKYRDGEINVKNLVSNLKYLSDYYIRRNIVLKPKSSNLRAKSLLAIRKLEEEKDINKNALDIIKSSLNMIAATNNEFLSSLLDSNIYEVNKNISRLIMIDLEREYGTFFHKQRKDDLDDKDEKGRFRWTIEHIMPQSKNLSKSWKDAINIDGKLTDEEILRVQSENIHKLGNLTLTGYNSEMSNRDFIEKRDYKGKSTDDYSGLRTGLFLNESIFEDDPEKESWNQEDIKRRTEILGELLLKLYDLN